MEVWTCADGRQIPFDEVTQQHWSNIFWFHHGRASVYKTAELALEQIKDRFDGELLPFNPPKIVVNRNLNTGEMAVVESIHENYKPGSRFDFGFLTIASSHGYSIEINPQL